MRNSNLKKHTDDREAVGVLANLYWNPCDDVEWRLRVLAERDRDGSQRLTALSSNPIPTAYTGDKFRVNSDLEGKTSIDRYQLSLHGRKDFDWGTLKSITSYQDWKLDPSTVDLDFTPAPLLTSRIEQEQTYWTQEVRFESPEDAGPLAWRTGLFASYKDTDGDTTRGYPTRFGPVREQTRFDIEESNVAGYGRLTYQSTERLTWEAGGRL